MQVTVKGKNLQVNDRLREYVEKKLDKLDRFLPDIQEARMELTSEPTKSAAHSQVAQLTIRNNHTLLRTEERSDDIYTSIDTVLDKMHLRIERYKGKRQDRYRSSPTIREEAAAPEAEEAMETEATYPAGEIVRIKRFSIIPMTPDEAAEQMELLGHSFFIFFNPETGRMNVLYRRDDGNYGLIDPEVA
jgi:putative sigma-54 modulation protein